MKNSVRWMRIVLCMAIVLPPVARAQEADPAVWGVYARLLGAKMAWEKTAALTYTWYWNGAKTAIVEDQGQSNLDTGEIKSLGGGRLARYVKDELLWTGSIQPDGSVIWKPEGGFFTGRGGGPFRVRLQGDSMLVQEGVTLENGRVTSSSVWQRWVGSLPAPMPVVAAASAPEAAASSALAVADAQPAEERAGPRALSAADLAKLQASMVRDKQLRAETLKRQAEEARQQEIARRQQAEFEAQMAAQRAEAERQARAEERESDNAFASALMGGLNTFKNEMAKNQAQQAQQAAFVANLQRQQQANDARQREQERQRQVAAQEQLAARQRAAAAAAAATPQQPAALAQQPRQLTVAGNSTAGNTTNRTTPTQPAPASKAYDPEKELRENAAADRLRRQQIADYQRSQQQANQPPQNTTTVASNTASKALPTATPTSTHSGPDASKSSCRVERNTTMAVGRNKTEESTRADVQAMAARQCGGKGQLGPMQCSSYKDISIDSHGQQHDLGTRTYDCTAVVDCGTTRDICYGGPGQGSAQ